MTVTVDFWYLVGLFLGFLGFVFMFGRLLLSQIDQRITGSIKAVADAEKGTSERVERIERDLSAMRAELPMRYVMREDYVRGQSLIEAKLDGIKNSNDNVKNEILNRIETIRKEKS